MDRLYTTADVTKKFQISAITLKRWLRDGKIEGSKVGHRIFFTDDDLAEFMARNRTSKRYAA